MAPISFRHKIIVIISLVLFSFVIVALARNWKRIFPVVIVDGKTVFFADVEENLEVTRKLDSGAGRQFATEQLIRRIKAATLASELGLDWKSGVDEELAFRTKNQKDLGFSRDQLLRYVIEPVVIQAKLRIFYNNNYHLNSQEYDKVQKLLEEILDGGNFAKLAKKNSDDKVSAQFGGDLGFFGDDELIPELERQIKKGPFGEIQGTLLVSRLGYHVIFPVETAEKGGQTLWHAKHILVATNGFEGWLDSKIKNIRVIHLIK